MDGSPFLWNNRTDFSFHFSSSRIKLSSWSVELNHQTEQNCIWLTDTVCLPACLICAAYEKKNSFQFSKYPSLFRVNNVCSPFYIYSCFIQHPTVPTTWMWFCFPYFDSISSRECFIYFFFYVPRSEILIVGHGNYVWNMESEYIEWCITFEVLIVSASLDFFSAEHNILRSIGMQWLIDSKTNIKFMSFALRCFLHRLFFYHYNILVYSHYWKSCGNDAWAYSYHICIKFHGI